jgi:hypothetical protein
MRNKLLSLWVLIFLLTAPAVALSDCVDLGRATSLYIQGAHTVIFYVGMRAVAQVEIPYCNIYQDSIIRLTRAYTCENDKIIVDGEQCIIGTVSSGATSPTF